MNNTETMTTSDTQDTRQKKHQSKQKGQARMNNTETLKTSDTQDTDGINLVFCHMSINYEYDGLGVVNFLSIYASLHI